MSAKTWWRAKADAYANSVKNEGGYGRVRGEWQEGDGWVDGELFSHFVVIDSRGLAHHLITNESGVFEQLECGGQGRVEPGEIK